MQRFEKGSVLLFPNSLAAGHVQNYLLQLNEFYEGWSDNNISSIGCLLDMWILNDVLMDWQFSHYILIFSIQKHVFEQELCCWLVNHLDSISEAVLTQDVNNAHTLRLSAIYWLFLFMLPYEISLFQHHGPKGFSRVFLLVTNQQIFIY